MLCDVSPHPPGPHVISAGDLDNPLALVTRLPDEDYLLALLLLVLLLPCPPSYPPPSYPFILGLDLVDSQSSLLYFSSCDL